MMMTEEEDDAATDPSQSRGENKTSSSSSSSDRSLQFFKVFLPAFSARQLQIPPDFVKHQLKGFIPDKATLKDRHGQSWNVRVVKQTDRLFIKDGWQEFVKDHSLEYGDFLIFNYNRQKSSFRVEIFARNGCLKEAPPCCSTTELPTTVKIESDEEEAKETQGSERPCRRPIRSCKRKHSNLNLNNFKTADSMFKLQKRPESQLIIKPVTNGSTKCPIPKHPHYVATIRSNTLMYISLKFLKDYKIQMKPSATIHDESGRDWQVTIVLATDRVIMTRGWSEVRSNNNLKEGDDVVLEFVLGQGSSRTCEEIHMRACPAGVQTERRCKYSVLKA